MTVINYLCPVVKGRASGGTKVIHRHAEVLAASGVACLVYQQGNPDYRYDWFESRAPIRTEAGFHPRSDFLVIPEVWAGELGAQARGRGFNYAIFVQNGYYAGLEPKGGSLAQLRGIYADASLVLSISDDTSGVLRTTYPEIAPEKILRVFPSVGAQFAPGPKSKIISYMPRKLPEHSEKLRALLASHLPPGWELVPIEMQTEAEVARLLAASSLFLSFSEREGFGLPPLEAALSGALVVGYTGQGGNEYFHPPNFAAVEHGDFGTFAASTLGGIAAIEAGLLDTAPFRQGIETLRARYSAENERQALLNFARRVDALCLRSRS